LYTHKREAEIEGKRLPMWEERVRKEAAKVLFSEFAYALKVEPTQIEDHIIDLIDP
jgi:RNA polymerase-interacting CarD/CdnL/TRCF family regulator